MKVIFLLISGGGDTHESDELAQRQTWADTESTDMEVIWLRGKPGSGFSLESRTLFVPCDNNFSSILKKTLLGLQWVSLNREFDLLIRSNTSTYFHPEGITSDFFQFDLNSVGGAFETSRKTISNYPKGYRYLNGSGLYLGKDAVNVLSRLDYESFDGIPDDIAIHSFLKSSQFRFYEVPRNNLDLHHIFIPKSQIRVKSWSKSDLTVKRMHLVHEYFKSPSLFIKISNWLKIEIIELSFSRISLRSARNFLLRQLNYIRKI